jgi:hypothetical protein
VSLTSSVASADSASDLSEPVDSRPLLSARSPDSSEPSCASIGREQPASATSSSLPETSSLGSSQSTLFAEDSPASPHRSPEIDWVLKMTVGSGLNIAGLSKNCGRLGCLEKILLGSSVWDSTKCLPIWRPWATPGGRLIFRLVPLERTTNENESGLLPTPAASDCKGSVQGETLERRRSMTRGVRLPEALMRMVPTPTAGNSHSAGRLDEFWIYLLNEIAEFLEGQSDVRDGSYGEQIPNRAMSLLQLIDQEIERLKRLPSLLLPQE